MPAERAPDHALGSIALRPMRADDVGRVPIGHQGEPDEVRQRIADLGSSAILAFDGLQHVGQLQFRRYEPGVRSPRGLHHPLYWADFSDHAPPLPERTLAVFCYHVGQLDDTDARDPRYQGRGLGVRLLDTLVDWARQEDFAAVVAKAVSAERAVMAFMGAQSASIYQSRGFTVEASWVDPELRTLVTERQLVPGGHDVDAGARVACCVLRLSDR